MLNTLMLSAELSKIANLQCMQLLTRTTQAFQARQTDTVSAKLCLFSAVSCRAPQPHIEQPLAQTFMWLQTSGISLACERGTAEICQDLAWEKLHTGDWKDVLVVRCDLTRLVILLSLHCIQLISSVQVLRRCGGTCTASHASL